MLSTLSTPPLNWSFGVTSKYSATQLLVACLGLDKHINLENHDIHSSLIKYHFYDCYLHTSRPQHGLQIYLIEDDNNHGKLQHTNIKVGIHTLFWVDIDARARRMNFCHGHITWLGFPTQPKDNAFQFRGFLVFSSSFFFLAYIFKQGRNVNKISVNPCVGILARISNPEVKRVSGPFSNRKLEEKIAVNKPNQRASSSFKAKLLEVLFYQVYALKLASPFLSPPAPILNM